MKRKSIIAAILMMVAGMQTTQAQKMLLYTTNHTSIEYDILLLDSIVFVEEDPITEEHEWVDLGLPSGTLWATCNVGASSSEMYGDFFAWGETKPKNNYSWSTYKHCNGTGTTLTKYCLSHGYNGFTDVLTELLPDDDAATINWGSKWQTPNLAQFIELTNSNFTTTLWTKVNGKYGRKITSKSNGNSIFLPAAGYYDGTELKFKDSHGYYWSRSLYPNDSYWAYFFSIGSPSSSNSNGSIGTNRNYSRSYGFNIRPVRKQ